MSDHIQQVPSSYTPKYLDISKQRIAVVYAEWNSDITHSLRDGAISTLAKAGVPEEQILSIAVPGAFELNFAAGRLMKKKEIDAIIILGCVIRGETSHYDCICDGVTEGITRLNIKGKKPVIFGLITTENHQQAVDRSGGKLGNKGSEAAIAALQMLDFSCKIEKVLLPL